MKRYMKLFNQLLVFIKQLTFICCSFFFALTRFILMEKLNSIPRKKIFLFPSFSIVAICYQIEFFIRAFTIGNLKAMNIEFEETSIIIKKHFNNG